MKIGIYARGLSEKSGGTRRMIFELTKRIIHLIEDKDELIIIHNCESDVFGSKKKNVKEVIMGSKNKLFCDYWLGPKIIRENKIESLWISKVMAPIFLKCRTVVSITDLSSFYPKYNSHPFLLRMYMNLAKRLSAKFSDKVHVISESTKKDIVRFAGIDEKKVEVIYLAADESFHEEKNRALLAEAKSRYKLPKKFLLFFGMISPRKNLKNLILAFNKLSPEYELMIAGGKGWSDKEIYNLIEKSKNVRHIGKVNEEHMAAVYTLATAFAFPSFYEGFGLPIIEAQKCGCPVMCSNNSSLGEIGKDSVLYFDPADIEDIAKKITIIMSDKNLRADLIKKGFKNADRFEWDNKAKELLGMLR